jgi:hypothetical protein
MQPACFCMVLRRRPLSVSHTRVVRMSLPAFESSSIAKRRSTHQRDYYVNIILA